MKIYFRIVHGHKGLYAKLIRLFTQSDDTHVEFCWPLTLSKPMYYLGAQPKGGVQVRPHDYLKASYTVYSVEVPTRRLLILQKFLADQIGKKYDFLAILNLVFFKKNSTEERDGFAAISYISPLLILEFIF